MSGVLDRRRGQLAGVALAVCTGLVALAGASLWLQQVRSGEQRIALPGFPALDGRAAELAGIRVLRPEGGWSLVKGTDGRWAMPERAGFPAAQGAVEQLLADIAQLQLVAERTADPGQYVRLGVGEPREGADGTLLQLIGADGSVVDGAMIGRRGTSLYVRRADGPTVYLADRDLPLLFQPASLLDLGVLEVGPEQIASVEVTVDGESYAILRRPDGGFAPDGGPPGAAATAAALAITRWHPLDVAPASAVATGAPDAVHVTRLRGGLILTVQVWRGAAAGEPGWAMLAAEGTGPAAGEVARINGWARGWAFRLAPYDLADFALPRASVMQPVAADVAMPMAPDGTPAPDGPVP